MRKPVLICLALWPLFGVARMAGGQQLEAPVSSFIDTPLSIRARGLGPGVIAALRATMSDSAGTTWGSNVVFRADAQGRIDVNRDSAQGGSYRGVLPGGLITMMDVSGSMGGRSRYVTPAADSIRVRVELIVSDSVVDARTIWLRVRDQAVVRMALSEVGLVGALFHPRAKHKLPAVLMLGGSEGGTGPHDVAALLAARGFVVLSLGYFNAATLPGELKEIPLEYFQRGLALLRSVPGVAQDRIAIFGTSKGAEAALLTASIDTSVRAVIAYAPSSAAWSCICQDAQRSSWTLGGQPVSAVPPGRDPAYNPPSGTAIEPAVHYTHRLAQLKEGDSAWIAVHRIRAPLLLVAGGADKLWPSAQMAEQISRRRQQMSPRMRDQVLLYPHAGHLIGKAFLPAGATLIAGGRLQTGGSSVDNARAQADAWPRVVAFLQRALAQP